MKNLQIFNYEGSNITFKKGESTMVNATEMAKPFSKFTKDWMVLKSTESFLIELSSVRRIPLSQLVVIQKGNSSSFNQGTWMHEDVALEFARWLSPKFAIWCNDRIKELLQVGFTATQEKLEEILYSPDLLIGLATQLKEAREENKRERKEKEQLKLQVDYQTDVITKSKPKVEYYENVINSENGLAVSVIASDLGCSAMHLNKILYKLGVQYRVDGTWMLYSKYKGHGYTITKTFTYQNSAGELISKVTMFWTQKGREFIHYLLHRQGISFKKTKRS